MKIEGFEVRIASKKCPTPQFSMSIEAKSLKPLKGVIEVLAIKYPPSKAFYSKEHHSVTLRIFNRMIGIYENGLVTFCAENLDDAKKILGEVKKIIEETRKEALTIGIPSDEEIEKWNKLNTLKLYNYLPKTNCKECGEVTCIALAAKVLSGEKKLSECLLLKRKEYSHLIEDFKKEYGIRILRALGWQSDSTMLAVN